MIKIKTSISSEALSKLSVQRILILVFNKTMSNKFIYIPKDNKLNYQIKI